MKGVNKFTGKMGDEPKTVDLPISSGTPVEVDMTSSMVQNVTIYVRGDFRWTVATDIVTGKANFLDKTKYFLAAQGHWDFPCASENVNKLYIISNAAAVIDGLSIQIIEFS